VKETEKTVAVIEDGVVVNVLVIDTEKPRAVVKDQHLVEYDETEPASIGLTYDETTGFEQPEVSE
jgi:hypothetical protein